MSKNLYARDVLTFSEYQELHNRLTDDEYELLANENTTVSESHKLRISAFESATYILKNETVKELLEYDLQHIFNYDERFDYIISKIERAIDEN